MEDKKGTVTYPVSTRYREKWDDWEAIREIVQNALDSRAKIDFDFDPQRKVLTIRDYGGGIELHHLLIGETDKDGESSIGKFGEGLKFALLVLVRQGRSVEIWSNNLRIRAKLVYMFDRQTLAVDWERVEDHFHGTEVIVKGIPRSYRERFLSLDYNESMQNKVLTDMPGQLFVKGIYVKDIDAVAGYNLHIERENPLSGDVDSWEVQYAVSYLIERTDDPIYISMLLQALKENSKKELIEFLAGSFQSWGLMRVDQWQNIATQIFGSNVCLSTDPELFQEMIRDGYRVVDTHAHFPKGFMKTDLQVIRSRGSADWKPMPTTELSPKLLNNLARATYLVHCTIGFPLEALSIGRFPNDPHTTAMAKQNQYIRVSLKALDNFPDLLLTLIEESIHYKAGSRDLTPRHEYLYNEALGKLIKYFTKDRPVDCPNEWVQELLNRSVDEAVNA